MLESTEVAATAGLLDQVGSGQLLWVWAGGMASVMLTAARYALIVDRYQRVQLIGWVMLVGQRPTCSSGASLHSRCHPCSSTCVLLRRRAAYGGVAARDLDARHRCLRGR